MDDARQVEIGEVTEPGNLAQIRHQPVLQTLEQRRVTDIRPLALALGGEVQLTQQGNPRLPLTQLRGPRQQLQAFAPHQVHQCLAAGGFVEACQWLAAEDQFTDLALTLSPQHAFTFIPIQLIDAAHLLGQH
ncbi:hypothetical protein D3C81_1535050 [compost metagenome]